MNFYAVNDDVRKGDDTYVIISMQKAGVLRSESTFVVIQRNIKNPLPAIWTRSEITEWENTNQILRVGASRVERPHTERQADIVRRDVRWNRIFDIHGDVRLYEKSTRNKFLTEHATSIGTNKETLLDDLRRYWLNGQHKDALLGDFWRCGQLTEGNSFSVDIEHEDGVEQVRRRNADETVPTKPKKPRGRPPSDGNYSIMNITRALHEQIVQLGRRYYLRDKKYTLRGFAKFYLRKFFVARDENGKMRRAPNGAALLQPLGMRPTADQIRKVVRHALSHAELISGRESKAHFKNNHRAKLGGRWAFSIAAGRVYEIDATIFDLWLISKFSRRTIIGKATLYLIVDRDNGLVVGLSLSLESPQWEGACQAIVSISQDWEALCKRLGVTYNPAAWVAQGYFPNCFVYDRGDGQVTMAGTLSEKLPIETWNLPGFMSSLKGTVEFGIGTIQAPIREKAPGGSLPSQARKRRAKKYEKDAEYDLDHLLASVVATVQSHNVTARTSKEVYPQDVARGHLLSPAERWQYSMENEGGMGRRYTHDFIKKALEPTGTAQVTQKGVKFKGLLYEFDEIRSLGWATTASVEGQFPVTVSYSPLWVDEITINDPKRPSVTYKGRLVARQKAHFSNYSFAEYERFKTLARRLSRQGQHLELAHQIALDEDLEAIAKSAAAEKKKETGGKKSSTTKTGGIVLRQKEKQERRSQIYGGVTATESDGPVEKSGPTTESPMAAATKDVPEAPKVDRMKSPESVLPGNDNYFELQDELGI